MLFHDTEAHLCVKPGDVVEVISTLGTIICRVTMENEPNHIFWANMSAWCRGHMACRVEFFHNGARVGWYE